MSGLNNSANLSWGSYCSHETLEGAYNCGIEIVNSYACLHENQTQTLQTIAQLDAETANQISFNQVPTIFLKNPSLLKKLISFGPPEKGLAVLVEIQVKYDSNAHSFFHERKCSRDLGLHLMYFSFGFLFDQLSFVNKYGRPIADCHLGNIFLKDKRFYWGELGVSDVAVYNSTEAEMYFMGGVHSILSSFGDVMERCNLKLGRYAIALLHSFHHALFSRNSVDLRGFLGEALEVVDEEIAKFPENIQDQLFLLIGPQLRSSFVILREEMKTLNETIKANEKMFLKREKKNQGKSEALAKKNQEKFEALAKENQEKFEALAKENQEKSEALAKVKENQEKLEALVKENQETFKAMLFSFPIVLIVMILIFLFSTRFLRIR